MNEIVTRSKNTNPYFQLLQQINRSKKRKRHFNNNTEVVSKVRIPYQKRYKIFLTSQRSANNIETIQNFAIVAVLTLGKSNTLDKETIDVIPVAYKVIDIQDNNSFDNLQKIQRIFPQTRKFLQQYLKQGNVLIHCTHGVNRSPLIVLDYLLNVQQSKVETAVESILEERNFVFTKQSLLLQTLFQ